MNPIVVRPIDRDELPEAISLLALLNPDVEPDQLASRLEEILSSHDHYELHGAYRAGRMVGLCGAWLATKVWCGRYLEIDNIVVDADSRCSGVGTCLMEAMEKLARDQQCEIMVLDSYASNTASHRLYHRLAYEIKGFHFVKMIGKGMNGEVP